jgi:hypothetical protein
MTQEACGPQRGRNPNGRIDTANRLTVATLEASLPLPAPAKAAGHWVRKLYPLGMRRTVTPFARVSNF